MQRHPGNLYLKTCALHLDMRKYVDVALAIPEEQHDLAVGVLTSFPITGLEEVFDSVHAYFRDEDWTGETLSELIGGLASYGIQVTDYSYSVNEERNWNAEWEAGIDPVVVSSMITIVPAWKAGEIDAPVKLIINPQMSFGTGHHPTTRMMCRMLEKYIAPDDTVLDVGTGSGVLGILAAKLGSKKVFAFDNNEWSVENASHNTIINGVADCMEVANLDVNDYLRAESSHWDLVCANLYRHILIPNAAAFLKLLKPQGTLLLSGILVYDAKEVLECFTGQGATLLEMHEEGEWCSIALTMN